MNEWIDNTGEPFILTPQEYQGFVYTITNTANGKFYIGKKNFWQIKKLPPLKGRKNKRHKRVETDWRDYWSSSRTLKQDVERLGASQFERRIIYLCKTKTEMAYRETQAQFHLDALLDPNCYNEFIGCRITARGLKLGVDN